MMTSVARPAVRLRGLALSALSRGSVLAKLEQCCALTRPGLHAMGAIGTTCSNFAALSRRG